MRSSYLDKLHPAVAFAFFLGAIAISVIVQHPVYLAASILGAAMLNMSLTGVRALKKCIPVLALWLIVAAMNPLFNTLGSRVLFTYWGRPYTFEALCYGLVLGGMLSATLLWFSAYNAVMTEDKFSYLFGALSPSLSLLLTTVLRMIPGIARKAKQIMGARSSIGLGAGDGAPLKERLRDGMTAVSVLTSWALEGGVVTADSMNSRGYGTGRRSCFHSYRMTPVDWAVALVLGAGWLFALVTLLTGGAGAEFTPVLRIAPVEPVGLGAYLVFLLALTILNWKEDITWHCLRSKI